MLNRQMLAAAVLLVACAAAHAEHFDFLVSLNGTYSAGGTDGCTPPLFDQPACPRPGHLDATLSFDTPSAADGDYLLGDGPDEISNFSVGVGGFATDVLLGDIGLLDGVPSGNIQAVDESEHFFFDWADRYASFDYDYGYHGANGSFVGTLSLAPEPAAPAMLLTALVAMIGAGRARLRARRA
jgi:hypothetical protein